MKIGINTYINNGGEMRIIGVGDVDMDENQIISMFGMVIPYDKLEKLLNPNTKPSDKAEVFSFVSGVFEISVWKLP